MYKWDSKSHTSRGIALLKREFIDWRVTQMDTNMETVGTRAKFNALSLPANYEAPPIGFIDNPSPEERGRECNSLILGRSIFVL